MFSFLNGIGITKFCPCFDSKVAASKDVKRVIESLRSLYQSKMSLLKQGITEKNSLMITYKEADQKLQKADQKLKETTEQPVQEAEQKLLELYQNLDKVDQNLQKADQKLEKATEPSVKEAEHLLQEAGKVFDKVADQLLKEAAKLCCQGKKYNRWCHKH